MDILFWSGGKDAWLALQYHRRAYPDNTIKLLTTFDETNRVVPHQQVELSHIKQQADNLELDLITLPLPPACPNKVYLRRLQDKFETTEQNIDQLIFGDWQLQDIKEWREKMFAEIGYSCTFPIWKKDLHQLLPVLFLNPVKITISAVQEDLQHLISLGETYDQSFVKQLQHITEDISLLGEYGEFHTKITFIDPANIP